MGFKSSRTISLFGFGLEHVAVHLRQTFAYSAFVFQLQYTWMVLAKMVLTAKIWIISLSFAVVVLGCIVFFDPSVVCDNMCSE